MHSHSNIFLFLVCVFFNLKLHILFYGIYSYDILAKFYDFSLDHLMKSIINLHGTNHGFKQINDAVFIVVNAFLSLVNYFFM